MIRINLLRDFSPSMESMQISGSDISFGEVKTQKGYLVFLKVALIIVVPYLLKMYEGQLMEEKFALVQSSEKELQGVKARSGKVAEELEKIKKYRKLKKTIVRRLSVIDRTSKNRLSEVLAIEKLQEVMEERTWLDELVIENQKMVIRGSYMSENDLSLFSENLEKSLFFSKVNVVTSVEAAQDGSSTQKKFEISSTIESI